MSTIRRISTIGDGSCFLHAVLRSIWPKYKNLNTYEKKKIVKSLRYELANIIDNKDFNKGHTFYETLSRGKLSELSESFDETKIEEMKRFLRSDEYFTYLYLEFISEVFNIDIYVINYKDMKLYNGGDSDILYKNRDSIIIGYDELGQHFEAMEVEVRPGRYETFFKFDSNIIKKITTI